MRDEDGIIFLGAPEESGPGVLESQSRSSRNNKEDNQTSRFPRKEDKCNLLHSAVGAVV